MAQPAVVVLRRSILAVFVLGVVGSLTELLLLGHDEDLRQFIPLVLFGVALALLAWAAATHARPAFLAFRATMALFIVAGLVGSWLHFQANREFQLEVDPSLAGWALLAEALQAKSPPALAPGVMVQLGLLGLAWTFRHPRLESQDPSTWS
ncbi:MAG: hypothetical protein AB7H81_14200 [Vicinamibacterales bacterium]